MSKKQLTERARLERDLQQLIALLDRVRVATDDEVRAELRQMAVAKGLFSKADLEQREKRYQQMGQPALNSPEWQAELQRMSRRSRPSPPSSINTDPNDTSSLYWQVLMLAARKARGEGVEPIVLPSQSGGAWRGLDGKSPPQVLTAAEARRLYRWLWRIAPGLLNACGDELRELIRDAGGIA